MKSHAKTPVDVVGTFVDGATPGFTQTGSIHEHAPWARALARVPEVVVLDEATSALVGVAERRLAEGTERRIRSRTLTVNHANQRRAL
jgi:ABC-type transport system involved in Fe-S cluster assembly fused permease/ATPase subunit